MTPTTLLRSVWAAACAGTVLCGCSRPTPAPAAPPAAPAMAPSPAPAPPPPREPGAYESPRPAVRHEPTPLPDLTEDEPAASSPPAGRQVLRCRDHGRVTYVDLNTSCAEGAGEPVTVFPTKGVEQPR